MTHFWKTSTYEIHGQHTCIYSPTVSHLHTVCSAMITVFDLLIRESPSSQVRLQPVHWYFQHVCLALTVLWSLTEAGSVVLTWEVCLFVWSVEVTQQCVCLTGQLSPLTQEAGEEKWWREKHSLVAFPPCVFFFWWRSPDHQALYPDSQIRCLESLHMT